MTSRSFVQWRAPPGRHGPRPLHGVWVDGRRDGSLGGCVAGEEQQVRAQSAARYGLTRCQGRPWLLTPLPDTNGRGRRRTEPNLHGRLGGLSAGKPLLVQGSAGPEADPAATITIFVRGFWAAAAMSCQPAKVLGSEPEGDPPHRALTLRVSRVNSSHGHRGYPCPFRARSDGEPRGTPGDSGARTRQRPLTNSAGQGPYTCSGCGI
jgi:hypothetical protein